MSCLKNVSYANNLNTNTSLTNCFYPNKNPVAQNFETIAQKLKKEIDRFLVK